MLKYFVSLMTGNYCPLQQKLQRVLVGAIDDDRRSYYHSRNPLLSHKVDLFEVI